MSFRQQGYRTQNVWLGYGLIMANNGNNVENNGVSLTRHQGHYYPQVRSHLVSSLISMPMPMTSSVYGPQAQGYVPNVSNTFGAWPPWPQDFWFDYNCHPTGSTFPSHLFAFEKKQQIYGGFNNHLSILRGKGMKKWLTAYWFFMFIIVAVETSTMFYVAVSEYRSVDFKIDPL
jgi:hypothetical protein